MKTYDFLIVGSGLFGSVFAHEARKKNKSCLVVEKRNHIGGNIYTEEIEGIHVHRYGAHIFHTHDPSVWQYIHQFADFNHYVNSPVAMHGGRLYNLPFNMNTFYQLWGVRTPGDARAKIAEQTAAHATRDPKNLEEQALCLVGRDIYETLIQGYTEKQWGMDARELPAFIIKRIPLRFTFDNNYFTDRYQGIPIGGYTRIIAQMLDGATVLLDTDFFSDRAALLQKADRVIFTGKIDSYYDTCEGPLAYRSLSFETKRVETDNFQGNAVVNYTERSVPYTRIIEHKHFEFAQTDSSILTYEYPQPASTESEPFYPINNEENQRVYQLYRRLAAQERQVVFGGRLGEYAYYDMDDTIASALACAHTYC